MLANIKSSWNNWWNKTIPEDELNQLAADAAAKGLGEIPQELVYTNPIKRWYLVIKNAVNMSCGRGSFAILAGCVGVFLFTLIFGGTSVMAVTCISVATVFGAFVAMKRFPKIEAFVLRWYKWLDLALFAFLFLVASTIFGLQIAAVTGVLVSIALILWKVYKDNSIQKVKASLDEFVEKLGNNQLAFQAA